MKINWITKLGSRKFWGLLAGVAISVMIAFGADAGAVEKVTGVIGAVGTIAVYIFVEGNIDAKKEEYAYLIEDVEGEEII